MKHIRLLTGTFVSLFLICTSTTSAKIPMSESLKEWFKKYPNKAESLKKHFENEVSNKINSIEKSRYCNGMDSCDFCMRNYKNGLYNNDIVCIYELEGKSEDMKFKRIRNGENVYWVVMGSSLHYGFGPSSDTKIEELRLMADILIHRHFPRLFGKYNNIEYEILMWIIMNRLSNSDEFCGNELYNEKDEKLENEFTDSVDYIGNVHSNKETNNNMLNQATDINIGNTSSNGIIDLETLSETVF